MSCQIGRILQFKEAMGYRDIILRDDAGNDITKFCQFAWSMDGVCWTQWYNYISYSNIVKTLETDFYLRIKFFTSLKIVTLNNVPTTCYNITLDTDNAFLVDFCGNPNLFNPYANLDCALLLQQQLSDSIICMLGIPIYYFKVDPDRASADYTFKEYSLHDVVSVKQIKLMVQDGQLPSSNYKMSEFDFDWETDWETEISKTQFATAFGDTAIPARFDFVYVPMMKRMWKVNAAYDEKNEGLMWTANTWKLSLIKYSESTNVDNNEFEGMIDNLLVNKYKDVFGAIEENEQHRQVGADPVESPQYASNSIYDVQLTDAVRETCTREGLNIDGINICHNNKVVARNIYNIEKGAYVTYQKSQCGPSGVLMFIYNNIHKYSRFCQVVRMGDIVVTANTDKDNVNSLLFNGMSCKLEDGEMYMVICRWDNNTKSSDFSVYKHICKSKAPLAKLKPEMYKFDYENPVCELSGGYNDDFGGDCKKCCMLTGPASLTNIKYYDKFLPMQDIYKESIKYVTKHSSCIINDLARPFTVGYGYDVK